jgi:hypothetical protein
MIICHAVQRSYHFSPHHQPPVHWRFFTYIERGKSSPAMRKFYGGSKPPSHYEHLKEISAGRVTWRLYVARREDGTIAVKVAAKWKIKHKANFWMLWDGGKLTGRDATTMAQYQPTLYKAVLDELTAK